MQHYMHGGPAAFRFELAGDLNAGDAAKLERDWRSASLSIGNRVLVVDLTFVTAIDEAARSLFRRWYARGAEFAASSKRSRELVESITEHPYKRESQHEPTYQPWFSFTKA
jgi:anti-anti-sigma regulatory factor